MTFENSRDSVSREVRIPLRRVDAVYGADNRDNAADDVVYCLRCVSGFLDQYQMEIRVDTSQDNPWYHAMVCRIDDISDSHFARFLKRLAELKLA
ncbi:MAG: hypothetical protein AAF456_18515 [Planctomycetota bacterium]